MVLDVAIFFERVRHLGNTMHDEVRRVMVSFAFLANVNSANRAEELLEEWRLVKRGHISVITNTRTR